MPKLRFCVLLVVMIVVSFVLSVGQLFSSVAYAAGPVANVADTVPNTIHVATTGSDVTGDGSASNPYATIQKGVDEAVDGDTIQVADGFYELAAPIEIVNKSLTIRSENGYENCIIDGGFIRYGITCSFSDPGANNSLTINGLTIQNTTNAVDAIQNVHLNVNNSKILDTSGTGILLRNDGDLLCKNCIFDGKDYAIRVYDSDGGSIQKSRISNSAYGIKIRSSSLFTITENEFTANYMSIYIQENASASIINNVFFDNIGSIRFFMANASGVYNNTIYDANTSPALYIENTLYGDLNVGNNIFWNESALYQIDISDFDDPLGDIPFTSEINIYNNDIKGGFESLRSHGNLTVNWLDGNISEYPQFVDPASNNYHLTDYSPCIGAGIANVLTTDIEGTLRGTPPDMGAYENVLDAPLSATMTVADAALDGYIHGYVYTWNGNEYVPLSVFDTETEIQPWEGFWTVLNNESLSADVDLLFRKSDAPPTEVPDMTFMPGTHYLFASPLMTVENDLNASSLGQQLGDGLYEQSWRIGRWQWDTGGYHNYNGLDPAFDELMSLRSGKGFWLQQITSEPITVTLDGTKVEPEGDYFEIALQKNDSEDAYTYHMTGNPYWYPMKWSDCMVRLNVSDGLPAAKTAVAQEDFASWHVGLSLVATDGSALDTYNRAGVMITGNDTMLDAFEMAPIGDFVQLAFVGGDNELTYDYRPGGLDEYSWHIELRTSYSSKEATLSFDNLLDIPDGYTITLKNDDTGDSFTISDTQNIPVLLSAGAPVRYTLTAEKQPLAVEGNLVPETFAIIGNMPNPFNPATTISYSLDRAGQTRMLIYNISGQVVETLVDGFMDAGIHDVQWHAAGAASGIYIARIENNGRVATQKMMLVK